MTVLPLESGWQSGKRTLLSPMWPGLDSQTPRHMWVEFVDSLRGRHGFPPGTSVFPSPQKPTYYFDSDELISIQCPQLLPHRYTQLTLKKVHHYYFGAKSECVPRRTQFKRPFPGHLRKNSFRFCKTNSVSFLWRFQDEFKEQDLL